MTEIKPKRTKPQGKINVDTVIKGILAGKKKKEIAVEAGSIAKDDKNKIGIVNEVQNRKEYKEKVMTLLEKLNYERERILNAMLEKELSAERHGDLAMSLERVNKITELLSGKPTEIKEVKQEDVKVFLDLA